VSKKSKLLRKLADYLSDISKLLVVGLLLAYVNMPIVESLYFSLVTMIFLVTTLTVIIIEFTLLREEE